MAGGGTENGTPVQLWDCNGTGAQVWQGRPLGQLYNPASGRCLDAFEQKVAEGTPLHIWDCHAGDSQRVVPPA